MATVIEALIVTLGLDSTAYKKGASESSAAFKKTEGEATRTAKEMEARGKQAAGYFSSVKTQIVGLLAAFTAGAGLKSFVSSIVGSDAALGRLANNVGVSVDQVAAWEAVAERAGGSAAGMGGSIQGLATQMQTLAATGQSSILPFLYGLHINTAQFVNPATSMSEKLLMISDAMQGLDPAKAQYFGKGLGLDEGTINVLMRGRAAVLALLAEQEKIGHTNAADAAAAIRLQSAWRGLTQASEDLGRKILTAAAPTIERMTAALLRLSEWAATHRPMVEAMFWGIAAAAVAFGAVLAAPLAGIAALSAGIGVAVAAIAVLYDDWAAWISGGESAFGGFWQYFADAWRQAGPIVMQALASIEAMFADEITAIEAALHLIYTLFFGTSGDIQAAWSALMAAMGQYFTDFGALASTIIGTLPVGFQQALAEIGGVISDAVGVIRDALHVIYTLFFGTSEDISAAWTALFAGFGHLIDDFVSMISHLGPIILNAFKSAFTGALGWVEGRLGKIWSAITGKNVEAETPGGTADEQTASEAKSWFGRMLDHFRSGSGEASGGSSAAASVLGGSASPTGTAQSAFGKLIARGEGDYNSVNRGAAGGYAAGTEDLENMTVAQVQAAQKAQRFNAAGRYQIIGPTLDSAIQSMGLKGDEKFDRAMQDKIFEQYLAGSKRPAIGDYLSGKSNDRNAAMKAASEEWASVADPDTGKSHYAGSGNNKASISISELAQALDASRAARAAVYGGAALDPSLVSGAGARMAGGTTNQTASTTTSEVNIGAVTVNTQAKDADGVAKGLRQAVRKQFATASQANYGLA